MTASSWMLQSNQFRVADAYLVDCYAAGGIYGTGWVNTPERTSGNFRYVGSAQLPLSTNADINVKGNVEKLSSGQVRMSSGILSLHNYFEFTGTGVEHLGNYFGIYEFDVNDDPVGETYIACPLVNPATYWGGGSAIFIPKPNASYVEIGYAFAAYGGTVAAGTADFGFTFQIVRYE